MTKINVKELIYNLRLRNIALPLSVELDSKEFNELKKDLSMMITGFGIDTGADKKSNLKDNEIEYLGVKFIGRLCTCNAHPEDWK